MQNLNDIFRSQRLLNTVNNDIHQLKLVHKVWLKIIEQSLENVTTCNFNPNILEQCLPVSIRTKILNISCESSLIASHMRFIEQPLLQEILDHGIEGVTGLNLIVMPMDFQNNTVNTNETLKRNVDPRTINTLKEFTRSCTSEKLRSSSERLLKQLEKNIKNS